MQCAAPLHLLNKPNCLAILKVLPCCHAVGVAEPYCTFMSMQLVAINANSAVRGSCLQSSVVCTGELDMTQSIYTSTTLTPNEKVYSPFACMLACHLCVSAYTALFPSLDPRL